MARQVIDIGALSLEGEDGDTTREGFSKVNANFAEVYTSVQSATTGKVDKEAGKSLVLDTEITKLATVQANATQNSTDAFLRNRLNHTGVQDIDTVSGLQAALDSKANTSALGTAAFTASTAYATAAQGTKADTAVQPNSLGTAAYTNSNAYATSLQGTKADTALQPAAIGTTIQGYSANLAGWASVTVASKQNALVSGTNIKTLNGTSLLGSGNLALNLQWGSITGTLSEQTDLQTALNSKLNSEIIDFTIIYPNGGTELSPATAVANSRYVENNPFPGYFVICEPEVFYEGVWGYPGHMAGGGTTTTGGIQAKMTGQSIAVKVGNSGILYNQSLMNGLFNYSTGSWISNLPVRVKVWKVKGATT